MQVGRALVVCQKLEQTVLGHSLLHREPGEPRTRPRAAGRGEPPVVVSAAPG